MFNSDADNNIVFYFFRRITILIGVSGMLLSLLFDIASKGPFNFGMLQLSGFIASLIFTLSGLRKIFFKDMFYLDGLLLLSYLIGIVFVGLTKGSPYVYPAKGLLLLYKPSMTDLAINILGFMPLSYLAMSYFTTSVKAKDSRLCVLAILLFGIGLSLLIECMQGFIPGRISSLYDLIANASGIVLGVGYFGIEERLSHI